MHPFLCDLRGEKPRMEPGGGREPPHLHRRSHGIGFGFCFQHPAYGAPPLLLVPRVGTQGFGVGRAGVPGSHGRGVPRLGAPASRLATSSHRFHRSVGGPVFSPVLVWAGCPLGAMWIAQAVTASATARGSRASQVSATLIPLGDQPTAPDRQMRHRGVGAAPCTLGR